MCERSDTCGIRKPVLESSLILFARACLFERATDFFQLVLRTNVVVSIGLEGDSYDVVKTVVGSSLGFFFFSFFLVMLVNYKLLLLIHKIVLVQQLMQMELV